ncbi:hypothetical protein CI610_02987 [invertebrate metagenome]|uniref:Reverse transcriptase domain-containing protein n=1 Tax=invertebrate metagenome TaxID=1711999 RepID=A0A2H9T4F1_9ZZZZ
MTGNDVCAWRAAIGCFYCKLACIPVTFVFNNDFSKVFKTAISNLNCLHRIYILLLQLSHYIHHPYNVTLIILLIAGDIHPNPGPNSNSSSATSVISLLHLNIRSLRNKVQHLCSLTDDVDIVCITETHLDNSIPNSDINISGFSEPFRKDRNMFGGGVAIYFSESLVAKRRIDLEFGNDETIWSQIKFRNTLYLICNVYRPPSYTGTGLWQNLRHSIDIAFEETPNIIITGDLNIDFLKPIRGDLCDILSNYNLTNVITEPTRQTDTSSTLLDPIIVSDTVNVVFSDVIEIERTISDHDAVFAIINIPVKIKHYFKRKVWLYDQTDIDKLKVMINSIPWLDRFANLSHVNEMCNFFTEKFLDAVDKCIPSKEIVVRDSDKPWMNGIVRRNMRKRDRLKKIMFNNRTESNKNKYKYMRNRVNNMIKRAKEIFYDNINTVIDKSTNSPKTYWKLLGNILKSKKNPDISPLLDSTTNEIIYDNDRKCELLNNYFSSVCTLPENDIDKPLPAFERRTDSILSEIHIDYSEVEDIINNLDVNKASGPDGISHKMLKLLSSEIAIPLSFIFNYSLSSSIYPDNWKIAHVMPIFKANDASIVSNYRPISLLSCIGKLFERVVHKHIYNFLIENDLIYKYQSGFLPNHSTTHQLIELYHSIITSLENYEHSILIFCDFSKAFDRVWHKGLLHKLNNYGISGPLLRWITSYLSNRKQSVFINDSISSRKTINAGVPQGSVLGPLFFLLYINDISCELSSLSRLFADDTSLSYSSHDLNTIEADANADLIKLEVWSKEWLMSFNPTKTEALVISNRQLPFIPSLTFNNTPIQITNQHKHLGVVFSNDCKWNIHVEYMVKKVNKYIATLRKLKLILNRNTLEKMYLTYIRPLLEYACEVWDNCGTTNLLLLEKINLEAARIVTGLPIFTKKDFLYQETGWLPLAKRRDARKLSLFYSIVNNLSPTFLVDLLPMYIGNIIPYNLRNAHLLREQHFRLQLSNNSFFPSTSKLWNDLNITIRNSPSLSSFKSNVKKSMTANNILYSKHFINYGPRNLNIIHSRLRNRASTLNYDLFRANLVDSPECQCGHPCEDCYHFFLICPLYANLRRTLITEISWYGPANIDVLCKGDPNISPNDNVKIAKAVQNFLRRSGRFD